jgi:hypothetical protein
MATRHAKVVSIISTPNIRFIDVVLTPGDVDSIYDKIYYARHVPFKAKVY